MAAASLSYRVVIPARHASARLPGKALADLAGEPMIVHVMRRARAAPGAAAVIVATDHAAIRDAVTAAGGTALMTSAHCASGTDRVAEVARRLAWDDDAVVVNVQGDEPLIPPAVIAQCAGLMGDAATDMATLCWPVHEAEEFTRADVVKVVRNGAGDALYFSRAPIPCDRDAIRGAGDALGMRHIGIYAYRVRSLCRLAATQAVPLERLEQLEQLRALWLGMRIRVGEACELPPRGVDTPQDLEYVRALMCR